MHPYRTAPPCEATARARLHVAPVFAPIVGVLGFMLLFGCTKTSEQAVVSAVEAACVPLLSAETPLAPAICVGADELIQEVADYITAHAGEKPPVSTAANGGTVVSADLYARLAARPAVRARVVKRCPACPVCTPAPAGSALPGRVAP